MIELLCTLFFLLFVYYYLQNYLLRIRRQKARLIQFTTSDAIHFVSTKDGWKIAVLHYKATVPSNMRKQYPVLLCHGLSSNSLAYDLGGDHISFAKYLQAKGYDVWAMELRG